MSLEPCKLCSKESTPWMHINGHICQDCYENSKGNNWISVKGRLPDKNNWKVYAVLTNQNDLRKHQIAWFQYSDKTFRLEANPDQPIHVTHWMELPEPPKSR